MDEFGRILFRETFERKKARRIKHRLHRTTNTRHEHLVLLSSFRFVRVIEHVAEPARVLLPRHQHVQKLSFPRRTSRMSKRAESFRLEIEARNRMRALYKPVNTSIKKRTSRVIVLSQLGITRNSSPFPCSESVHVANRFVNMNNLNHLILATHFAHPESVIYRSVKIFVEQPLLVREPDILAS
ncbi:hypothetical protein MIMGU_mgv1a014645mg [Erythranthe guttata]|uniref:Uncharacterized protein n=1 Tax=Erythranthe guttata TaxID=4155 RepID=A0A022Q6M7_ERYGU|nr:hypothetical protein MIMGU_mgv1a014645mg [Erythranthe guttata]